MEINADISSYKEKSKVGGTRYDIITDIIMRDTKYMDRIAWYVRVPYIPRSLYHNGTADYL